jgi:hypothetical protein
MMKGKECPGEQMVNGGDFVLSTRSISQVTCDVHLQPLLLYPLFFNLSSLIAL